MCSRNRLITTSLFEVEAARAFGQSEVHGGHATRDPTRL